MNISNKISKIIIVFALIINYCETAYLSQVNSDEPTDDLNDDPNDLLGEIEYYQSESYDPYEISTTESTDYPTPDVPKETIPEQITTTTAKVVVPTKNTSKWRPPWRPPWKTTNNNKAPTTSTSTTTPLVPPTALPKCNSDGRYNGSYEIAFWPPVDVGKFSIVPCPQGLLFGCARWECMDDGSFDQTGPDWNDCYHWLDELPKTVINITDLDEAIEIVEKMSNNTDKNNTIVNSQKLIEVLDIIQQVQIFVDNVTDVNLNNARTYASNIIGTFSNIIDQKYAWINATAEEKTGIASKILLYVQYSSFTLVCSQNLTNKVEEIMNENIRINTFVTNSDEEIEFPINSKNSSILIPSGIMLNDTYIKCNNTAIGAVIDKVQDYLLGGINECEQINSNILSFSLTNKTQIVKLSHEVTIRLKHKNMLQFGDKTGCVYWDFNNSLWSSEGCYKVVNESDRFHTVCKCNHLTNFAALMDVSGREGNDQLKSILTYCCGVLSIIGLILTINLVLRSKISYDKNSRKGNLNELRSIITCNLCVCLLMTNMLVLFGMDRTNITWLCQTSSGLLLYFLLSSFFWMLMEGNYLYRSLVSCFNYEFNRKVLYGVGYGAPFVICIIGLTIIYIKENIFFEALFDERYNYFCWISSTHYKSHIWLLVGPALCVILFNILLMFVSLKTAFKVMKNYNSFALNTEDKSKAKLKQIISFIFLSFLLGITWISFLLYIHQTFDFYFSYLFIVLNGSQGLFIFLYHLFIRECGSRKPSRKSSFLSKY